MAEKGKLVWPVRGKVKTSFGVQPNKTFHNWIRISCAEGEAVRSALVQMGYGGVQKVRIGKRIRVDLEAANEAECRRIMDEICSQILANPTMETYEYEIKEESGK